MNLQKYSTFKPITCDALQGSAGKHEGLRADHIARHQRRARQEQGHGARQPKPVGAGSDAAKPTVHPRERPQRPRHQHNACRDNRTTQRQLCRLVALPERPKQRSMHNLSPVAKHLVTGTECTPEKLRDHDSSLVVNPSPPNGLGADANMGVISSKRLKVQQMAAYPTSESSTLRSLCQGRSSCSSFKAGSLLTAVGKAVFCKPACTDPLLLVLEEAGSSALRPLTSPGSASRASSVEVGSLSCKLSCTGLGVVLMCARCSPGFDALLWKAVLHAVFLGVSRAMLTSSPESSMFSLSLLKSSLSRR